jgi:hypothetical protein
MSHEHLAPGTPSYSAHYRDELEDLDEGEVIEEQLSYKERVCHRVKLFRRKWRRMRRSLRLTLAKPRVDAGFILVVVLNLAVLALRYRDAPPKLLRGINGVDLVSWAYVALSLLFCNSSIQAQDSESKM